MPERLVILQDAIMPYRRAFYNQLAKHYDLWVVHSGPPSVRPQDNYREAIVPAMSLGPFRLQRVRKALAGLMPFKAVLTIFDLRWPITLWGAYRVKEARRLLWGHRQSRHALVNLLRYAIMRQFDAMVQYGEEDVAAMIAGGIPASRIYVAPNTVDVPNHVDTSGHPKTSLLYVGRLQRRKRLEELLDGFAGIAADVPPHIRVELVGDGEIRGELAAQASRLGIADRVVFHGSISDPDRLLPIFARAFAYVSPDNVGLGVLHAFAYGVPVITSAPRATARVGFRHGPEFRNLRHLENSIVFDAADGLQGPLLAILSQKGLARKLGRQAYADYRSKRSISAMAEGIEAAVEDRANTAQAAVGG